MPAAPGSSSSGAAIHGVFPLHQLASQLQQLSSKQHAVHPGSLDSATTLLVVGGGGTQPTPPGSAASQQQQAQLPAALTRGAPPPMSAPALSLTPTAALQPPYPHAILQQQQQHGAAAFPAHGGGPSASSGSVTPLVALSSPLYTLSGHPAMAVHPAAHQGGLRPPAAAALTLLSLPHQQAPQADVAALPPLRPDASHFAGPLQQPNVGAGVDGVAQLQQQARLAQWFADRAAAAQQQQLHVGLAAPWAESQHVAFTADVTPMDRSLEVAAAAPAMDRSHAIFAGLARGLHKQLPAQQPPPPPHPTSAPLPSSSAQPAPTRGVALVPASLHGGSVVGGGSGVVGALQHWHQPLLPPPQPQHQFSLQQQAAALHVSAPPLAAPQSLARCGLTRGPGPARRTAGALPALPCADCVGHVHQRGRSPTAGALLMLTPPACAPLLLLLPGCSSTRGLLDALASAAPQHHSMPLALPSAAIIHTTPMSASNALLYQQQLEQHHQAQQQQQQQQQQVLLQQQLQHASLTLPLNSLGTPAPPPPPPPQPHSQQQQQQQPGSSSGSILFTVVAAGGTSGSVDEARRPGSTAGLALSDSALRKLQLPASTPPASTPSSAVAAAAAAAAQLQLGCGGTAATAATAATPAAAAAAGSQPSPPAAGDAAGAVAAAAEPPGSGGGAAATAEGGAAAGSAAAGAGSKRSGASRRRKAKMYQALNALVQVRALPVRSLAFVIPRLPAVPSALSECTTRPCPAHAH